MTPAKGFAEMKDSGIHWMGRIPNNWKLIRAKFHFTQTNNRGNETPILLAASQKYGVCPQSWLEGVVQVSENTDLQQFKTVHKNDFVISLRSFQGGFERSDFEGVCSPAYQVFHADNSFDNNFLKYLFKNELFIDEMNSLTVGIREGRNIKYEDFANSLIFVPPLDEQTAIASYLDAQCAKIDEIIAQAKASIEDYKQWKASIIYEAVTKGLDPNVEMKDSGVEWIGEVPMRWKIVRLKYLLSTPLQYGANETGLPYDESLPRYIRITDITLDGKLKTSGMQSLSEEKSEGYILDDEDILLARSGATVGKAFYYRESYGKAAFAGYLIRAKINSAKALPKFIYYSTMSAGYEKWKETAVIQATIQNIGASRYNEYSLAIPPIAEQLRIIEFLDDKMEKIDSLMAEKQSLIDDLESYKKSLIYEVVTGKRRV